MKTYVYLFFGLRSLMGFQTCSNDEVDNVKPATPNDVESHQCIKFFNHFRM